MLDPIARLTVGIAREPLTPAEPLFGNREIGHVDRVAMLEVHVALVDGLKAGPTRDGRERA